MYRVHLESCISTQLFPHHHFHETWKWPDQTVRTASLCIIHVLILSLSEIWGRTLNSREWGVRYREISGKFPGLKTLMSNRLSNLCQAVTFSGKRQRMKATWTFLVTAISLIFYSPSVWVMSPSSSPRNSNILSSCQNFVLYKYLATPAKRKTCPPWHIRKLLD